MPQTLEKIGDGCFVCRFEGLETITIPASVKEIGKAAFGNDWGSSIKSIYCESQDPVQAKDIFPNFGNGEASPLYDTCILYVPVGCVDKYKASEEWGRFANIKEFTPTAILEIVIDAHNENLLLSIPWMERKWARICRHCLKAYMCKVVRKLW